MKTIDYMDITVGDDPEQWPSYAEQLKQCFGDDYYGTILDEVDDGEDPEAVIQEVLEEDSEWANGETKLVAYRVDGGEVKCFQITANITWERTKISA